MTATGELLTCFIAIGLLALSYFSHHRAVRNRPLTDAQTRGFRTAGTATLVLCYWLASRHYGPAYASVLLLGWVCLSSIILVILLSYKPRWLQPILPASAVVCLLGLLY